MRWANASVYVLWFRLTCLWAHTLAFMWKRKTMFVCVHKQRSSRTISLYENWKLNPYKLEHVLWLLLAQMYCIQLIIVIITSSFFLNRNRKYYKEIIIVVVIKCGIQFIKTIHSRKQNDEAMTTQHQKSEDSQVEIGSKNLCVALKLRYNKNGRVNMRLFCLRIKISNGMLLQGEIVSSSILLMFLLVLLFLHKI